MRQSNTRIQTIGIIGLAICAVLGLARMWSKEQFNSITDPPPVKHHYRIDLLAQEVASPGKVIHANVSGKELAQYVCAPEDAAVGLVSISDTVPNSTPVVSIGPATDPAGQMYSVRQQQHANLLFVIVERGFAQAPSRITVPIRVMLPSSVGAQADITLTQIPTPVRVVSPPSQDVAREAEKIAIAENIQYRGGPFIRIVAKAGPNEQLQPHILALSYSPATHANFPNVYTPDAVKVRIDRSKLDYVESELIYRNAEIEHLGGVRVLRFPSTQEVGTIMGDTATIQRVSLDTLEHAHFNHSNGSITFRLQYPPLNHRTEWAVPPLPSPITCIGVSPSLEAMGLEWLTLQANAINYSQTLKAASTVSGTGMTKVPVLKLRFKSLHTTVLSSQILVLPVHNVKDDPILFPRMPTTMLARPTARQADAPDNRKREQPR